MHQETNAPPAGAAAQRVRRYADHFARITRLAEDLLRAPAQITVITPQGVRSFSHGPTVETDGALFLERGEPVWLEDASADPRTRDLPQVKTFGMGFIAGAPIRLPGLGLSAMLWSMGHEPRAYNAEDARKLGDLAAMVAELEGLVTAREKADRSLSTVIDAAPIAVALVDADLKLVRASRQMAEKHGLDLDGAVDRPLAEVSPGLFERFRSIWENGLQGVGFKSDRIRLERGEDVYWTQMELTPLQQADGAVTGLLMTSHDVTELSEALEAAQSATRAKTAFLATMSHEIRTPLNGVLGMAQAMAADELSERQAARLDVIRQSGASLLAILNDVLDLSKIEAGKMELEDAPFDLAALLGEVEAVFRATAEAKGLSFTVLMDGDLAVAWKGDVVRLRQILSNLVSNAIKFTSRGEVRLEAHGHSDGLRLIVADTGIGISRQALGRLFEKFEQADTSTTRRYGGTGLGLAICRDLAALMGGQISAESREGRGARFTVDLPLRATAPPRPRRRKSAKVESWPAAAPLRVLAAEDNPMNQLVLRTLLEQVGVDPVIVDDGEEALAAWEDGHWDLILMDVQMPRMDGITATRLIREREAAEGRLLTPIVALTANAMDHQVADYARAGMCSHVAKPIEAARLFAALQAALDHREGQGGELCAVG